MKKTPPVRLPRRDIEEDIKIISGSMIQQRHIEPKYVNNLQLGPVFVNIYLYKTWTNIFSIVYNYQDVKQPVIKRVVYDSNSIDLF